MVDTLWRRTTRQCFERNKRVFLSLLSFASQARLWVQLMKELRQGVKLKKVQEQPFNTLPTEFSLTPFEMLMQDIRARKFQLRKVMVRKSFQTANYLAWWRDSLWRLEEVGWLVTTFQTA